ncbi:Signal transduction histidine-protein kinase BarA [bacterium HR40]|nr:Signal transduction histidine-protein kinase BarA [bacterium HR40]
MTAATATPDLDRSFLAFVTHDMREPLNAVVGMTRLLAETPLDAEQKGYVAAIGDAAETLLTLVNDLLDLARVEAGRLEFARIDFDLADFLERLVTLLRPTAEAQGARLELALLPGLPARVRADPARLRQILLNLLGNAVKYGGPCTIRLDVAAVGRGEVEFRVIDHGPGMSQETLARLFEPWRRGPEERAGGPTGSGLGMLLARRLVEAMGGSMTVESREGAGTRVTVRLVLPEAPALPPPATTAAASRLRVLLVDPQPRTRLRDAALLRGFGAEVEAVSDLAEARRLLAGASPHLPDIVLLDRDAAGELFTTFGQELRALPGGERIRLVLLSAAGLRGDADRARAAGYDAFLGKPLSARQLEACLVALARGRPPSLLTAHELEAVAGPPLTILVADDNPVNLRLLSVMLGRLGHRVLEASDGQEALALFEREPVDLVLLDVQMPVLDGLATVARIRAHPDPAKAATPVVAVTANALAEDVVAYRRAGMDDCLAKPIDRLALGRVLASCRRSG